MPRLYSLGDARGTTNDESPLTGDHALGANRHMYGGR
jgi:hypothetical protein